MALGSARTVLNVGVGAGSDEPTDRYVVALEPSAHAGAATRVRRARVDGVAERLPFDDDSFDAAMATLTVDQWPDVGAGLREMRRVTHGPVVILTFDGDALDRFWLADYVPELIEVERRRYPSSPSSTRPSVGVRSSDRAGGKDRPTVSPRPTSHGPRRFSRRRPAVRSRRGDSSTTGWRSGSWRARRGSP